jgi:hypothetical protein
MEDGRRSALVVTPQLSWVMRLNLHNRSPPLLDGEGRGRVVCYCINVRVPGTAAASTSPNILAWPRFSAGSLPSPPTPTQSQITHHGYFGAWTARHSRRFQRGYPEPDVSWPISTNQRTYADVKQIIRAQPPRQAAKRRPQAELVHAIRDIWRHPRCCRP